MTARAPAAALAVALVAAGSPPLLAQYVEESETLRDHRARDEAYAERVERQAASPSPATRRRSAGGSSRRRSA